MILFSRVILDHAIRASVDEDFSAMVLRGAKVAHQFSMR